MILPANGKTMLLLLLGFLIRLRRREGATTDHPNLIWHRGNLPNH